MKNDREKDSSPTLFGLIGDLLNTAVKKLDNWLEQQEKEHNEKDEDDIFKGIYLFFDTETTGLPTSWQTPTTNLQEWPHVVQLAWAQYNDSGEKISGKNYIIKPEGFNIPISATTVHGISNEKAMREGASLQDVLQEFIDVVNQSDIIIAHNLDFDLRMIEVELFRKNLPNYLRKKKKICTMKSSTDFCQIPGPYGNKWPKLSELHAKLFNSEFQDRHDASIDVQICAKCFFELKKEGVIKIDSPVNALARKSMLKRKPEKKKDYIKERFEDKIILGARLDKICHSCYYLKFLNDEYYCPVENIYDLNNSTDCEEYFSIKKAEEEDVFYDNQNSWNEVMGEFSPSWWWAEHHRYDDMDDEIDNNDTDDDYSSHETE